MKKKLPLIIFKVICIGFLQIVLIGTFSSLFSQGFESITSLSSFAVSEDTGEKPQSKVWPHNDTWWAVLPNSSGTHVWRLDGTTWTNVLTISSATNVHADCKVEGNITHILLYRGTSSELVSIEYLSGSNTYQLWSIRPGTVSISLDSGVETATIDIDGTGRMWLASDVTSDINVRWSNFPYSSWSAPITIATGIGSDDICCIASFDGKVGVLWSNQNTDRFGFKYHIDGADPNTWSIDEVPASQSAQNVGSGMADDHLNMAVASDGTIYAAVKTSYDVGGYPKIALLVRRPAGTWDDLYEVDQAGTRGIVLLNETLGKVVVIYTSSEGNNNIIFKESSTSVISFGSSSVLISGSNNNVTGSKQNYSNEFVVFASNGSTTASVLASESVVANELVGYWKMDEGSGPNLTDASTYGNNGSISGTPSWIAGKDNLAIHLNGSTDYATIPDNSSLDITNEITVAAWIKPEIQGTQRIIRKVDGSTGYSLFLENPSPSRISVRFNGNASLRLNSTSSYLPSLNSWIHVAATYDGSMIRMYINGITEDSLATVFSIGTNNLPLGIGAANDGSNKFTGALDEVRIYNKALSQQEILALLGSVINPPEDPSNLLASSLTSGGVQLNWTDNSDNEDNFEIDRAETGIGGTYAFLTSVNANVTSYDDLATNPETEYCYRVRAVNLGGNSNYCNPNCATTLIQSNFALEFDGSNDYVDCGTSSSADITGAITLEAWVRSDVVGTQSIVKKNGTDSGYELSLSNNPSGGAPQNYFFRLNATNTYRINSTSLYPTDGTWTHIAATYDGSVIKIYVNGVQDGTDVPGPASILTNTNSVVIGTDAESEGTKNFNGGIDEVRIWEVARTAQDILDSYNQEIYSGTGLIARWGMNEGTGISTANSIPGSLDGTLMDGGSAGNGPLWISGAPLNVSETPPNDPSALSATSLSSSEIQLTWTDNSDNEENFEIERSTTGITGTYNYLTTVTTNSEDFTDSGLDPQTEYCYRVRAVNSFGNSGYTTPDCATTLEATGQALSFNGTNSYVTFGQATTTLGATSFTLECWFKWNGGGTANTTGSGGITIFPILTKGSPETDGSNLDANYIFGIQQTSNVIAGDFEDTNSGLNHPITGVTTITPGEWNHAALTFDDITKEYALYLNGVLEGSVIILDPAVTPRFDSQQPAALATMIRSNGTTANGFFEGVIDEARIWDHARSLQEIQDNMSMELTSGTGLLGRWGLNEGTGLTTGNSISGSPDGSLVNSPVWVDGAPFTSFTKTIVFVEGSNGYSGTHDSYLFETEPDLAHGTDDFFEWDGDNAGGISYGLLRFDQIFGTGPGQIPPEATIISAELSLNIQDAGDDGMMYELLVGWDESTATFNNFGGEPDLQPGEYEYIPVATIQGIVGLVNLDVTDNVNNWSVNPSDNYGWVYIPTNTDGVEIASSENTLLTNRPKLTVEYDDPPTSIPADPTDLSATVICYSMIELNWTDNSDNEAFFEIERSTDGPSGTFSLLATVPPNTESYIDDNLNVLTEYCYRVKATNILGSSAYTNSSCGTTPDELSHALDFGVDNAYVSFSDPDELDLAVFTLETWFKKEGAGSTANTGTGGVLAIPLVTKGVGESENSLVDMNYFLGIHGTSNVLVADFEEGAGGSNPSQNHPVMGVTPIVNDEWYHAAVTYNGTTWQLFLNGVLETELTIGQPVASSSTQLAGLATALTSTGTPNGHFDGVMDEVRIWDHALTQAEIILNINEEISVSKTGLVARWSLNEGSGSYICGSAGTVVNGNVLNTGYSWVPGAPFDILVNMPPGDAVIISPPDGSIGNVNSPELAVQVSDPESDNLSVIYYGRKKSSGGEKFTIVGLPDTQYYTAGKNGGSPAIMDSQTQWVANNTDALNIVYVCQLGDCVDEGDTYEAPWQAADLAMSYIEDPVTTNLLEGIPYGIAVGNHDQSPGGDPDGTTNYYNQYFGEARFSGRSYYGGHYGSNNDNHYQLFSASGMDFIAIQFEYDPSMDAPILAWAENLLQTHSDRRAILISHHIIGAGNPGSFGTQGQAIYEAFKDNPNVFLMLSGHVPGEGRRTDNFNGNIIHSVLADYQSRSNGGNGWLRIMEFDPSTSEISVKTYSPWLDQWETDGDSQFTLSFDMNGGEPYQLIGSTNDVPSGNYASIYWPALEPMTEYEWYVIVDDGNSSITSQAWTFTTGNDPQQYLINVDFQGKGSVVFNPEQLAYDQGTIVDLTAVPANGWTFSQWLGDITGTNNPESILVDDHKYLTAEFENLDNNYSLTFNGTTEFLNLGNANGLNTTSFTLETWFKKTGPGTTGTTGSNGIINGIPMISKGAAEAEQTAVDLNYYLGLDNDLNVIAADFEEDPGSTNHPVYGVTNINENQWYHAAVTYDGTTWRLYLNGVLETELVVNATPALPTTALTTFAASVQSDGTSFRGLFEGEMDEVRIWNYARSVEEVRSAMCTNLSGSESGLLGYWRFDEVFGSIAEDGSGTFDAVFSGGLTDIAYKYSGAAIGTESVFDYDASGGYFASLSYTDGDFLEANTTSGTISGIQVYRKDAHSLRPDASGPVDWDFDNNRYWGVFVAGTLVEYTMVYHYDGNPFVYLESELNLAKRDNFADDSWEDPSAILDPIANTLTLTNQTGTEYALASYCDALRFDLTVLLEGPFNGSSMDNDINSYLPLSQPYSVAPWNYPGTEYVTEIPGTDIVDWILVEFRDAASAVEAAPSTVISRQAAFLRNDGQIVDLEGTTLISQDVSYAEDLFVVLYHRNHVHVMSANPLSESAGVFNYDFSSGENQAYGGVNGHKALINGYWGMISGDADADGQIENPDIENYWKIEAGFQGYFSPDLNLDSQVDNKDKDDFWFPNMGKGSQVPN